MRILAQCRGRENAIERSDLLRNVQYMPGLEKISDRQLRACINTLRKAGALICSTGGVDGGYWWPVSYDEVDEYLSREVYSRISDLNEQAQAMKKAALERWGEEITNQARMF